MFLPTARLPYQDSNLAYDDRNLLPYNRNQVRRDRNNCQHQNRCMISMLVQMFIYGISFIVLGSTLAVIYMLTSVENNQIELFLKQKQELSEKRTEIAVLQMRPHFR